MRTMEVQLDIKTANRIFMAARLAVFYTVVGEAMYRGDTRTLAGKVAWDYVSSPAGREHVMKEFAARVAAERGF